MSLPDVIRAPVVSDDPRGTQPERVDLREVLTRDHARLDALFEDLTEAFNAGAREEAERIWSEFDAGLLAHMAQEEHWLLPAFEASDPREVAGLLREHEQIRQKLLELGIGVDLHSTRAETVNDFVALLRSHARREEAVAYRWAERELGEAPRRLLSTWLAGAFHSLGHGRPSAKKPRHASSGV